MAEPELPPSVEQSWVAAETCLPKLDVSKRPADWPGLQPLDAVALVEKVVLDRRSLRGSKAG